MKTRIEATMIAEVILWLVCGLILIRLALGD